MSEVRIELTDSEIKAIKNINEIKDKLSMTMKRAMLKLKKSYFSDIKKIKKMKKKAL